MNKLHKSFLVILVIVVIFLCGYSFHLRQSIDQQASKIAELEATYKVARNEINQNVKKIDFYSNILQKLDSDYAARKEIEIEPSYQDYKERIKSLLDKRIGSIVSDKPLHEGNWFVTKVQFIGPTFALVYYEDGHDLFTTLIQILKTAKGYDFVIIE